jgi:transcriptional regulator with XRE-family HTH domain
VRREPVSAFGQQLRHWRSRSGLSQLELAALAGTTPRHVSFIETGRSRPGRELVLRLATALDVPVRERNVLLQAAGLPAAYPTFDLADEAMTSVRRVLARLLHTHEPYPAWVGGRGFRFFSSNRAAERLFPGMCQLSPAAIVDLWFGPGLFRQLVENWQDVVLAGVASLRRDAAQSSDPGLIELVPELPVVCPRLSINGRTIRTISTVLRFDTAVEVTASELRVELMFPADEVSETYFREVAGA